MTVSVQQLPPVTVTARWTIVHVDIQLLGANAVVKVRQTHGTVVGPDVMLPAPLTQPHQSPIPPPRIVQPLCVCDRMVKLEGLSPGATVTLDHEGAVSEACFGGSYGTIWLTRGLQEDDHIRVKQAFPRCQIESDESRSGVSLGQPPAPVFP